MRDFKNLEIWKIAFDLNRKVYLLTDKLPREEIYGVVSQIRRAIFSVQSNICEGCGRRTDKEFVRFLNISYASLKEVEGQILSMIEIGYLQSKDVEELIKNVNRLQIKIRNLIKFLERRFSSS